MSIESNDDDSANGHSNLGLDTPGGISQQARCVSGEVGDDEVGTGPPDTEQ